jgi:hypothetical protein
MANKTSIIVGGVGGALPFIIDLLHVDAASMFQGVDTLIIAGYAVRVLLLIILGAFLVWINSEDDLRKALQIGIMAPAIIVGFMNSAELHNAKVELEIAKIELQKKQVIETSYQIPRLDNKSPIFSEISSLFISPAFAQGVDQQPKGIHHDPSYFSKFWYGLTGSSSNGWFVIVGSHRTQAEAAKQVSRLKDEGYKAIVYPPYRGNKYYGVMIGSWLSLDEAKKLKSQALADGLPEDTYLWKFRL